MCGITGVVRFDYQPIDIEHITAFNDSLFHRGPDAGNVIALHDLVAFGHRRLAIVDLDHSADQPMSSRCGRYVITFNGEIYNFIELREELISLGYTFRTKSDTEVILAAYDCWNEDCLHKFNGMWAFCIWDHKKQVLFASRDRFGVKPFYYYKDDNLFAFASEQKAFASFTEVGLEIEPCFSSFAVCNPTVYESTEDTIFRGIARLGPGETLTVSMNGTLQKRKWWELSEHRAEETDVDDVFSLFNHACNVRTRTDVDIAFSLSGGMDSASVVSYTQPFLSDSNRKTKAFIGSFPNSEFDEFDNAKLVAQSNEVEYERIIIPEYVRPEDIIACMVQAEDIMRDPPIGQWFIYKSMKSQGFKVSLEGHGGDELLGGYTQHVEAYLGDRILEGKDIDEIAHTICLIDNMRSAVGYGQLNLPLIVRRSIGLDYTFDKKGFLSQFMANKKAPFFNPALSSSDDCNGSLLEASLRNDFSFFTLPTILRNYDKASMGHSVEVRSPFLDWQFVLAAFALPMDKKIACGKTKALLRDYFLRIPRQVRESDTKLGFNFPLSTWLKNTYTDFLQTVLNDSMFLNNTLFDGRKVSASILKHVKAEQWSMIQPYWPLIHLTVLQHQLCRKP